MKKNFFRIIVFIISFLIFGLCSCDFKFFSEYSFDDNNHWHTIPSININYGFEEHDFDEINCCNTCGYCKYTVGLSYTLSLDESYYIVTGIGEVSDTFIRIPSTYNGIAIKEIGAEAFSGCSSLNSIEIPNSVTYIGISAFSDCSSLNSIEIPNSVSSIDEYAFSNCSSLTSIEIPSGVTYMGFGAFSGCSSLESMALPFIGDTNTSSRHLDYLFGYRLSSNGLLGEYNSAYIPSSLKSIKLLEGCTSIGSDAFYGCSSLVSIEIPSSVTSIGSQIFAYCSSLDKIVVDVNNKVYDSRNNCNAIIETSTNSLVVGCGKTIIPDSVTSIGSGAFSGCSSLTSIEIPDSVTNIKQNAFSDCSSLTSIKIPSSVTCIERFAFTYCDALENIIVDVNNKVYDSRNNCNAIIETSTNSLVVGYGKTIIPDSVTSIGWYAFAGCSSLTSIEIPNSVTSIGLYAFYCCNSLESIELPDSVKSIESYAFYNCSSLTIYCEASSKPSGWDSSWNYSNRPVVWDYKNK